MDLLLFIVLTWRLIGCYRPHMDSTIIVSYRIVSVAGPSLSSRGLSPTPLIGNYRIVIYLAIILSYLILNFPAMLEADFPLRQDGISKRGKEGLLPRKKCLPGS